MVQQRQKRRFREVRDTHLTTAYRSIDFIKASQSHLDTTKANQEISQKANYRFASLLGRLRFQKKERIGQFGTSVVLAAFRFDTLNNNGSTFGNGWVPPGSGRPSIMIDSSGRIQAD